MIRVLRALPLGPWARLSYGCLGIINFDSDSLAYVVSVIIHLGGASERTIDLSFVEFCSRMLFVERLNLPLKLGTTVKTNFVCFHYRIFRTRSSGSKIIL